MLTEIIAAIVPATMAKIAAADPVMDALTNARWALEGSSDFWALSLQIATGFVALGVVIEIGATVLEVLEERQHGSPIKWHQIWTFIGGALVAVFVVVEGITELRASRIETELRKNNAAAQGVLDKRERDATAAAVSIANRFGGLQGFVSQKLGEMNAEEDHLDQNVSEEKGRTEAALRTFKSEQGKLEIALTSAQGSATKAASAQDSATQTAGRMSETLKSEQAMRDQMKALTTDRLVDDAHFEAMVKALKPFAKTQIDLAMTRDPECAQLLDRIADALTAAGWTIQPWAGPGFSLNHGKLTGIGELTVRGVVVEINGADRAKFSDAVLALANGIAGAGIPVSAVAEPDKLPNGNANPNALKAGLVHLIVGVRTAAPPTQAQAPTP